MSGAKRKKQILDYVSAYLDEKGYAPSYREISRAVGLRSLSSVARYIHALTAEGKLALPDPGPERALRTARSIGLQPGKNVRRIRLELADGGVLYLDCGLTRRNGEVRLCFSGVLDAEGLVGRVSRIVGGGIDTENE